MRKNATAVTVEIGKLLSLYFVRIAAADYGTRNEHIAITRVRNLKRNR